MAKASSYLLFLNPITILLLCVASVITDRYLGLSGDVMAAVRGPNPRISGPSRPVEARTLGSDLRLGKLSHMRTLAFRCAHLLEADDEHPPAPMLEFLHSIQP